MNKRSIAGLLLAVTPSFVTFAGVADLTSDNSAQKQSLNQPLNKSTGKSRYIIVFDDKAQLGKQNNVFASGRFSAANANQLVNNLGGDVLRALPAISGMSAQLTAAQLAELKNNPQVKLIELDPLRTFQAEVQPHGITQVQADQLSDGSTGSIKICIADTGIDLNHEDLLSDNITGEVSNTLTIETDIGEWFEDSYGHGTHMAGTIAAIGGNNIGTVGVNPSGNIKLHVVKVVHNPGWWPFYGSDLIAAVGRCQAAGANIINMSIAGDSASVAEEQAMQAAYDAGILLVGASGKGGSADHKYPASYDSVISVAAIDAQEATWQFSHYNNQIELSAPGVDIKSTTSGNNYANFDGTSVAAAYTSGTAGLVWSHHSECSNVQIRSILQQSAKDLAGAGRDDNTGFGLIQAKDAVDLIDLRGCNGNGVLNSLPTISGIPATSVDEAQLYQFLPVVVDADEGDTLILTIVNKPGWATFDTQTGELSGTPGDADVGVYNDIVITVTDVNGASASTQAFSVEVVNVDFPPTPIETEQTLALAGSDLVLSNPDGSVMSIVSINDADADPTNELQTVTQSGDTISLSHGGGSFVLVKGDKGDTGERGIAGEQGGQGIQGITGEQGDIGLTGAVGAKGDQGIQGVKGDIGLTGATGTKGDQGIQGTQGVKGAIGSPGTSSWTDGSGIVSTAVNVNVAGNISADAPTADNHLATKAYVDSQLASVTASSGGLRLVGRGYEYYYYDDRSFYVCKVGPTAKNAQNLPYLFAENGEFCKCRDSQIMTVHLPNSSTVSRKHLQRRLDVSCYIIE